MPANQIATIDNSLIVKDNELSTDCGENGGGPGGGGNPDPRRCCSACEGLAPYVGGGVCPTPGEPTNFTPLQWTLFFENWYAPTPPPLPCGPSEVACPNFALMEPPQSELVLTLQAVPNLANPFGDCIWEAEYERTTPPPGNDTVVVRVVLAFSIGSAPGVPGQFQFRMRLFHSWWQMPSCTTIPGTDCGTFVIDGVSGTSGTLAKNINLGADPSSAVGICLQQHFLDEVPGVVGNDKYRWDRVSITPGPTIVGPIP